MVGEILDEGEDLLVSGKCPRISIFSSAAESERVVQEAHDLPREVRTERSVEAAVDDFSIRVEPERIGLHSLIVNPGPTDPITLLEDDDSVALSQELASCYQPCDPGSDDGDVARSGHGGGGLAG